MNRHFPSRSLFILVLGSLASLRLATSLCAQTYTGDLHITNSLANGRMVLSWNSRGTLEMATNVNGPWFTLTNSWPYTNQITGATSFFRLDQTVDTTTLHKKILCGYQGWFRCAGDDGGNGNEWDHWNRDWSTPPSPALVQNITFEMWPDLTGYSNTYPVPGFTYPGGAPSSLYSADDQQVVDTHFNWMRDYGIDGAVVQRFVSQLPPQSIQVWKTNVLLYARAAANRTGRAFAIQYDMSGANTNTLFYQLTNDWAWLTSLKIPQDPRYLHHNGKPILMIFGFYSPAYAGGAFSNSIPLNQQIVSWFETNTTQPVTLIGSGEWEWASDITPGWSNLFRSFNVFCPWNTGNYTIDHGTNWATTSYWPQDLAFANNAGMGFLPQIYPGYSAHYLTDGSSAFNQIPRLGGRFLWKQINDVANLGLDWAYLGMFDEVDEGTAIYKVTSTPPTQVQFLTYNQDGITLPNDWYLRLSAEGSKVLAGERPNLPAIPISP